MSLAPRSGRDLSSGKYISFSRITPLFPGLIESFSLSVSEREDVSDRGAGVRA
ncbi:hypothetical protein BN903_146 [Halorubrum sp. AJ67]|nr:hypothetical protein BN903_146 [Halorubrum sp. AJ67]